MSPSSKSNIQKKNPQPNYGPHSAIRDQVQKVVDNACAHKAFCNGGPFPWEAEEEQGRFSRLKRSLGL
jgi:hypothetical protein